MGFNFIGSKSNGDKVEYTPSFSITNFQVIRYCQLYDSVDNIPYVLLWLKYPEAPNYDGNKILLYQGLYKNIIDMPKLDPHFILGQISPIARFEPTEYGWQLGIRLIGNL